MNSRLDKNNSGKSHKKIIIISIVAILFVIMLMITVASLSIAGKSSIETESAKQSKRSKKVSSSSQISSEKSVSIIASTSSSVSSSSESNNVTDEERSIYFTRMSIGLAVGKVIYYDAGKDTPKLDYFEEIPEGFKIYFVDGMSYDVRDTIYSENLESEYNFGNNHGFEIYFDHAPAVRLKVPQGLGGVYDITPDMLNQYAIR
ncbi:hypothetical protein [Weissella koreensis]|nr:hypothetical protein [Weissella koreensis]EJF33433.1 hypothetical protein JC2156_07950 [Weissella koreensis KCTC 3621]